MKKSLLLLLTLSAIGCTRTVYVPQVSHYREIDTLLMEVADSSLLTALLECDSNNRVVVRRLAELTGSTAHQTLTLDDGRLELKTRWRTKYVERIRETSDTLTVVKVRESVSKIKHVPRIYRMALVVSLMAIVLALWRVARWLH